MSYLYLVEMFESTLPINVDCDLQIDDNDEPWALFVDGGYRPLDDEFPHGADWSFVKDIDQMIARCDVSRPLVGEGDGSAPKTPAKKSAQPGEDSFSFRASAELPAAGEASPNRGRARRPPPSASRSGSGSGSESGSGSSESGSGDGSSGSSGGGIIGGGGGGGGGGTSTRPAATSDQNARAMERVLAKYDVKGEELNDYEHLMRKKGFTKMRVLEALSDVRTLLVDGKLPAAVEAAPCAVREGGGGTGTSDILSLVSRMNEDNRADRKEQQAALLKLAEDSRADQARQQNQMMQALLTLTEKHANSVTNVAREMMRLANRPTVPQLEGERTIRSLYPPPGLACLLKNAPSRCRRKLFRTPVLVCSRDCFWSCPYCRFRISTPAFLLTGRPARSTSSTKSSMKRKGAPLDETTSKKATSEH